MSSFDYPTTGKRIADSAIAFIALVVLFPILLLIGIAIRLSLGSPILFRHERPGLHARPFNLLKFRTMTDAVDDHGNPLPDHDRVTRLGTFLRSMSLDELPELFNVLKGDMSIVGPRPLLMRYIGRYSPEQMRRHNVRPGITGWAQVHGRNAISWGEKFSLDVWYVDHVSLWLDLKIVVMTVWKLLKREGISQPGYVSSEEFKGSNQSV